MHKIRNYLLIAITLLSSVAATGHSTPLPLTIESSANYDIKMYAANLGISIKEATRRFALRDKIGNTEEKLIRDNPNTFAGFWLVQTPKKFGLVAQFSGKPKKTMSAYMIKELAVITEVRFAALSLAELTKRRTKAEALLTHAGINFASDIDVMKNRVELYVPKQKSLNSDIAKKLRAQLPKNVVLIESSSKIQ